MIGEITQSQAGTQQSTLCSAIPPPLPVTTRLQWTQPNNCCPSPTELPSPDSQLLARQLPQLLHKAPGLQSFCRMGRRPKMLRVQCRQTWHKFPNPGGDISTKKCPISNPGGTILTKNVLFTTQGAEIYQMSYLQPRGHNFNQKCHIAICQHQGYDLSDLTKPNSS